MEHEENARLVYWVKSNLVETRWDWLSSAWATKVKFFAAWYLRKHVFDWEKCDKSKKYLRNLLHVDFTSDEEWNVYIKFLKQTKVSK